MTVRLVFGSIMIILLFANCANSKQPIKFDLYYVDAIDSGYRDLYFFESSNPFLKRNEEFLEKDLFERPSDVNLFLFSPKVVNKEYYEELSVKIKPYLLHGVFKQGMIRVSYLDKNGNKTAEFTVDKDNYTFVKEIVLTLNKKYQLSEKDDNDIQSFFLVIEKDFKEKNKL
jgi:hypothetical protein